MMVAVTYNIAPSCSSLANFKAWGQSISAALTALGIEKTADAGQVDWGTTTQPSQADYSRYEVRKFTDTLQATKPLFFKFEFGRDGYHTNLSLNIIVGGGSNGNGGIVNTYISVNCLTYLNPNETLLPCIFSGSSNRLAIAFFTTISNASSFFAVERTKDNIGRDTNEGAFFTLLSYNGSRINRYIPFSGAIPASSDTGIFTPTGVTSGALASDVCLYPNFFFRGGQIQPPGITHFGYFANDVQAGTINSVTVYGQNRNYYFLPPTPHMNNVARGTPGTALAMLYE